MKTNKFKFIVPLLALMAAFIPTSARAGHCGRYYEPEFDRDYGHYHHHHHGPMPMASRWDWRRDAIIDRFDAVRRYDDRPYFMRRGALPRGPVVLPRSRGRF